jgi:hypothetical protein
VWLLNFNNVHNLMVVSNFEWEIDFAKFAIQLLELKYNLLFMFFSRSFS